MSQHISQHDLEKYHSRRLLPDELLAFDAHLAECEMCFGEIADLRSEQAATLYLHDTPADDIGRDEHLSYGQLASYVDDQLGEVDKEIVEVHKRVCDHCSEQIDALFQLRATLELESDRAEPLKASTGKFSPSSLLSRFADGSFLRFAAPVFAVSLLAVLILAVWFMTTAVPSDVAEVVDPADEKPASETIAASNNANFDTELSNADVKMPLAGISLADRGARIEIDADGNLKGIKAPQFESRIKAALTTQGIEISSAARDLRANSGVLMGDGQPGVSFALTTPVGRIIEADRPNFRWRPLKDAESYVVAIYDANFNKITESPSVRQPAWTSGVRLKRGVIYQWQVTALKDGQETRSPLRPAPDARFKILDANAVNEIAAARRQGNSRLVLGIVYASAGLVDEAERELQALLNQNPKSEIVRKLLNKVKAAR